MIDLFRIVYCSRNVLGQFADAELNQILQVSRRNNAAKQVTGALLYDDGIFAQTLEGPFDAVQEIFERIQADPRHDDVIVLQADTVSARCFGGWAMAHATPANPAEARAILARVSANDRVGHEEVVGLLDRVLHGHQARVPA